VVYFGVLVLDLTSLLLLIFFDGRIPSLTSVIGKILNNTHSWRSVLLPGDAAEAAGLTCCTYDADFDNESEPDTE
jgi:hypothetical protein